MAMYNQVFDMYHCIYRIIHILKRLHENEILELDRLRIWDFYVLFPYKIHEIRLGRDFDEVISYRKRYIRKLSNPYNTIYDGRKLLERLRPYQMGALTCLASYGIVDSRELLNNKVKILDSDKLLKIYKELDKLADEEHNALSWLCLYFRTFPMNGVNGFKSRTKLLVSKYDSF